VYSIKTFIHETENCPDTGLQRVARHGRDGMVPSDVVNITTSVMYLSGLCCLVAGGIDLILSLL